MSDVLFDRYKGENTKATFRNVVSDLENLGQNLSYFSQDACYNSGKRSVFSFEYINYTKIFNLDVFIEELLNDYLEVVLDIFRCNLRFANNQNQKKNWRF